MNERRRGLVGGLLVVTGLALIAGSLALWSWGSDQRPPGPSTPALSGAEQRALRDDRVTIEQVPAALRQVTAAMAYVSGSSAQSRITRTRAAELLFEHPELDALLHAVERPGALAAPLQEVFRPPAAKSAGFLAFGWILAGMVLPGLLMAGAGVAIRTGRVGRRRLLWGTLALSAALTAVVLLVPDGGMWRSVGNQRGTSVAPAAFTAVQADLAHLEVVYDEIVPALQFAGAEGGQVVMEQDAQSEVASSPTLHALAGFLTEFDRLYGAGVLISQEAASAVPASGDAATRWLFWESVAALVGVGVAAAALVNRDVRRARFVSAKPELRPSS